MVRTRAELLGAAGAIICVSPSAVKEVSAKQKAIAYKWILFSYLTSNCGRLWPGSFRGCFSLDASGERRLALGEFNTNNEAQLIPFPLI
jgi:hypothetical protein